MNLFYFHCDPCVWRILAVSLPGPSVPVEPNVSCRPVSSLLGAIVSPARESSSAGQWFPSGVQFQGASCPAPLPPAGPGRVKVVAGSREPLPPAPRDRHQLCQLSRGSAWAQRRLNFVTFLPAAPTAVLVTLRQGAPCWRRCLWDTLLVAPAAALSPLSREAPSTGTAARQLEA